jgi:hypothetical protein
VAEILQNETDIAGQANIVHTLTFVLNNGKLKRKHLHRADKTLPVQFLRAFAADCKGRHARHGDRSLYASLPEIR